MRARTLFHRERHFRLAKLRGPGGALLALLLALAAGAHGCTEAAPLAGEQLVDAFKEIHRNVYSVYRLGSGSAVYDALAQSCAGRELEREVFEVLKCAKMQRELCTFITILDVIYNTVRVEEADASGGAIFCKWIVIGTVRHPTHIHRKVNLNEALYRVAFLDEGLRIVGLDLVTNQALEVTQP